MKTEITEQEMQEVHLAAKARFNCKKTFPKETKVIKNQINGRLMYFMPILIENGGKGTPFHFMMYVDTEIRKMVENMRKR